MTKKKKEFNPALLIVNAMNFLVKIVPGLVGRIVFYLFCHPKKKKVKPAERNFLATADLIEAEVDGRQYAVYHWGFRGPIALLAHGWESQSGRWRKTVPVLLKAGYQVIAVDAPGHGRSDGGRFTMIEYAGIIRFLLQKYAPVELVVGHSVGASSVGWALGTIGDGLHPRKVILMAPFSTLRYTIDKSRKALGISDAVMQAMELRMKKLFNLTPDDIDLPAKVQALGHVDVLIIHDKHDNVTNWTESVKIHEAWPGSRFVITETFGHGLTSPEVYEMIGDYAKRTLNLSI